MPEDISLDNVLNTGEDGDAKVTVPAEDTKTPEQIAEAARIAAEADAGKEDDKDTLTPEQIAATQQENSNNLKALLGTMVQEEGLSEEDKTLRTDLLTKFKGTTFDSEGNILNEKGEQVASFDKVLEYTSEEEELTLDPKGNQIDSEGNIVKTKVELAVENTVSNKLHADSDYEFLDEEGNTKIYSDDDAGINDYANDVAGQLNEDWKSAFFNQTPELAEVSKHLLSGGTMDTYNSAVDYSKLDIATMNKDDKLKHIRRSFEVTGLGEDRINGLLQLFSDSNTIDAEVAKAIPALIANEASVATARNEAYDATMAQKRTDNINYWGTVNETVSTGKLADITIPETDKQGFFDYLSADADGKGNSQEMLDSGKETLEQQLQVKYLRFKGFDLSKLVDSKVRTEKVVSLRERMRKSAKLKTNPLNAGNAKTSGKETEVSLSSMLS